MDNVAFTTSGAIADTVDKKVLVVLRDGRKLIGVLRSYDQFGHGRTCSLCPANFVLQDAVERIHHGRLFAEVPRGLFLVRGENVVLLGEIDLDAEDEPAIELERVTDAAETQRLLELVEQEAEARAKTQATVERHLREQLGYGMEREVGMDAY